VQALSNGVAGGHLWVVWGGALVGCVCGGDLWVLWKWSSLKFMTGGTSSNLLNNSLLSNVIRFSSARFAVRMLQADDDKYAALLTICLQYSDSNDGQLRRMLRR